MLYSPPNTPSTPAVKFDSAVDIATLQSRLSLVYHESEIDQEDKVSILSLLLRNRESETQAEYARYEAQIQDLERRLEQTILLSDALSDLFNQQQLEEDAALNQAMVDNHLLQSYILDKSTHEPSDKELEHEAALLKYENRIDELVRGNRAAASYYKNAINEWQSCLVKIEQMKQAIDTTEDRFNQMVVENHLLLSQSYQRDPEVTETPHVVNIKYNQLLLEHHLLLSLYLEALGNPSFDLKWRDIEFDSKVKTYEERIDRLVIENHSLKSYYQNAIDSWRSNSRILDKHQEAIDELELLYNQATLEKHLLLSQVAELEHSAANSKKEHENLVKEADELRDSLISVKARLRARDSYLSNRFFRF